MVCPFDVKIYYFTYISYFIWEQLLMHFITLFNHPRDRLKLKAKYNDT